MSALSPAATAAQRPLRSSLPKARAFDWQGMGLTGLTGFAALLIVLMVLVIMGDIIWFGWRTVTWEFLASNPKEGMTAGGIFPAIFGTVALVILMVVALIPFGVGAAIYLHEYARPDAWFTRVVRFSVNNLAGVPSIVFGLFGLGFFIQFVGRGMDRAMGLDVVWGQPSLMWAALTLALLNLPVVIVTAEEALRTTRAEATQRRADNSALAGHLMARGPTLCTHRRTARR